MIMFALYPNITMKSAFNFAHNVLMTSIAVFTRDDSDIFCRSF